MPLWLNILLLVLLLALVVAVIMENGHPSRTLAWVREAASAASWSP